MTEPTEAAEAHRLITEAFADHEAEVVRVLEVVQRAAAAYAAGDKDTAGALLVEHCEQDEDEDDAAYTLCLGAVSGVGFVLDGALVEPPCRHGGKHGDLVDTAVHAGNLASTRDDDNLSRILGAVWDQDRDAVFPFAVALVVLLAEILESVPGDGDRDA